MSVALIAGAQYSRLVLAPSRLELGLEATTVSSQRLNHATQYSVAPFPLPDLYFYSEERVKVSNAFSH